MNHSTSLSIGRIGCALALSLACFACGGGDDGGEPSKPDAKTFMTSYFVTFDEKDQDQILELYAPDVSAEISGLGKLAGRDAVRDSWLVPFTSAFPDYKHTVNALEAVETSVTADFVFEGTHQGPLLGFQPTGKSLVLPIKGTYSVENEVVTSFKLEYEVTTVFATIHP